MPPAWSQNGTAVFCPWNSSYYFEKPRKTRIDLCLYCIVHSVYCIYPYEHVYTYIIAYSILYVCVTIYIYVYTHMCVRVNRTELNGPLNKSNTQGLWRSHSRLKMHRHLGYPPTRRQGEVVLTQVPATDPIGTFKHSILRWAAKSTIPAIIPKYTNGQDPSTSDYHLEMIGRSYLIPASFSTKVRSHSLWTPTPRRSCSPVTELKLRTGRSSL